MYIFQFRPWNHVLGLQLGPRLTGGRAELARQCDSGEGRPRRLELGGEMGLGCSSEPLGARVGVRVAGTGFVGNEGRWRSSVVDGKVAPVALGVGFWAPEPHKDGRKVMVQRN